MLTEYISTPVQKKVSLGEESWKFFSQFVSRYQWAFDDPSYSPRAAEITHAILNRGKDGCCTFWREGKYKYVLPVLHTRHFENALANHRKIYYVSYGKQVLLYFDIDLHYDWQTEADGQEARRLIDALLHRFFGDNVVFWSLSSRGINGYLKVNLQLTNPQEANRIFARLQEALERFLAFYENLADFEIKGRVGFMQDRKYVWAQYGKLPIHKDWSFSKLEEFKSMPTVSIHSLVRLCEKIEARIPLEVLERHKIRKKNKGHEPLFKGDYFLVTPAMLKAIVEKYGETWRCTFSCSEDQDGNLWFHRSYYRPGQLPLTEPEWREARNAAQQPPEPQSDAHQPQSPPDERPVKATASPLKQSPPDDQPIKATPSSLKINVKLADLASEPDSFKRQKEALFRYARYLKRVPTIEEGLKLFHDHRLFTGDWEQHQEKRKARTRDILKWIANTFDAGKCANGSVNVGQYDEWARKKFPRGINGRTRSWLSEEGIEVEGRTVHVSPDFIAVFIAICEFALITDKNQDGSLPHNRAKEIWEALYAKGLISVRFCARKWAVCREEMVWHGIVVITDRDYHSGKAMRWALGPYFPFLGLWKKSKVPSLQEPGEFARRLRRREEGHNTLLRQQPLRSSSQVLWMTARAPP